MKVLITGGAGYVGGALTDLLKYTEHDVRIYDCLLYEDDYRKEVEFVQGDIREYAKLKEHTDWADVVVWLAALVGDPACAFNVDLSTDINETPLKWLAKNFDGRIIFTSTASVYGAQDGTLIEGDGLGPLSVYGITKMNAEKLLLDGGRKDVLVFRYGTLFGIGDLFSRIRFDLVVNVLTLKAHSSGKIKVFGGDQFRPLLHVKDAARAIKESICTDHEGIYNLSKQDVRIIDLATQIRNHFPDLEMEITKQEVQDTRNYRISAEKAKRVLGFVPTCSIDQGIEEIKALLEEGRIKDFENPRYNNKQTVFLKGGV